MSSYYFCSKYKIIKLFIPKRVLANKPFRKSKKSTDEQIIRSEKHDLTTAQEHTVKEIKTSSSNNFLIQGVTGSGKTEIYSRIVEEEINNSHQVLILVPEISLTPQTIEYFEKSLGHRATVVHSKLSMGERFHNWINIWKGHGKLVIGSRSALLAPFANLSMIIIDEEHENSYKQSEKAPRYHVHQLAKKMQELDPKIKVILGSATPSIESSEKFKENTFTLNERIGNSTLPEIEITDLREEFKKHNYSIFSEKLHQAITEILEKKEQAILFLNRRGSASSVVCRDCGYTCQCPDCETSMTYHSRTLSTPRLICHHCGKITDPPTTCPTCQSVHIRYLGIGTQKIEMEVKKEFPGARVLRADKDTTNTKNGFNEIYQAFRNHEADILVGTQMIAKGLHLPKVNLVGVILSDIGLNIPDFRSNERIFQLMTQVAGRAGRSGKQGKVILQTYNPENIIYEFIQNQNFTEFFNYERTQRKIMKNPPFSKLAKILVEGKTLNEAKGKAEDITNILQKNQSESLEINNYPAYFTKLRNKYRYIVLIKESANPAKIHKTLEKLPKEYIMNPSIKIDIDPISIT